MNSLSDPQAPPVLLAVFAHPDDEVFRCGGTLALLAKMGVRVHILTFTHGEAGSCGDPPVCLPEDLADTRAVELFCSCQTLGLQPPIILDYKDGDLINIVDAEGISAVTRYIQHLRPQIIITWAVHGISAHPDHIAVSRWTTAAFQQSLQKGDPGLHALYYMVVLDSIAKKLNLNQLHTHPDQEDVLTMDVHSVWEQKMSAINCHRTQTGQTPILRAAEERQRLFLGLEHFVRIQASQPDDNLLNLFNLQIRTALWRKTTGE